MKAQPFDFQNTVYLSEIKITKINIAGYHDLLCLMMRIDV